MTWLRRNRWSLVAVAVLTPVAFLVSLSSGWWDYVEAENGRAIPVQGSNTVEYGGAQFSLLEWHAFDSLTQAGQSASLLPGTSLVTATIGIRPGQLSPFCDVELTDTSARRTWPEAGYSDADFSIADDAESYCDSTATEPYRLQVYFVVPDDAADHPVLRLSVSDELHAFLAFAL